MPLNIFADFHHPSLYYSLHLLLERRMGHTLFRPLGLEWANAGYWKIIDLCQTDYQRMEKLSEFLLPNINLLYYPESWNNVIEERSDYFLIAPSGNIPCEQRGLSISQFLSAKIDVFLASFSWNIPVFQKLIQLFHPSAKLVVQVGNEWDLRQFNNHNVMASVIEQPCEAKNIVFYRQEFDLDTFFATSTFPDPLITSFIQAGFSPEDEIFVNQLELSTKYDFRFYGKQARDGHIGSIVEMANIMQRSKFGLHLKGDRDGYGHVIHNWSAVGRPVIFRSSQYRNCLGGKLLTHMQTGIDIDQMTNQECANFISSILDDRYVEMCQNVRNRFAALVDFEQDAYNVQDFLRRLNESVY